MTIFNIAIMSDVHLGHSACDLSTSLTAIDIWLEENKIFEKDLLIITGDLFDKGLSFTQQGMPQLLQWWFKLAFKAMEHNLVVRVLEGTELHDRKQGKILVHATSIPKLAKFDCKYVYDIEVERLFNNELSILYLRDNHPGDISDITNKCNEAILQAGLQQVDIIAMHGNFSYHLPSVAKAPYYDEHKFLAMSSGFIVIGHNHDYSLMYDRIITPGSFDANTHADVTDKGGVLVTYNNENNNIKIERLLNKNQNRFLTLENMSVNEIKKQLKLIKNNNILHLRIIVETIEIKELLFTYINQNYNNIKLRLIVKKDEIILYNKPSNIITSKVFNLKDSLNNIIKELPKLEIPVAEQILIKAGVDHYG